MTDPETLSLEGLDRPRPPRRRCAGGGFSAESLLASILAHLAVVFLVIVLAPDRSSDRHDGPIFDLTQFVLPEASSPQAQASAEAPEAAPAPAPAPEPGEPVEIPAGDEAEIEELAEAPAPEAAAEETAQAPTDAPAVPESSLPHEHGAYDVFEVYKAAVAERVNEVTASSRELPARSLFAGRLAIHLYLNVLGAQVADPKICMGHSEVYLAVNLPEQMAQRHFSVLQRQVWEAVKNGGPYPPAPPGVEIPKEMTYFIDLGPIPGGDRTN